MIAHELLRELHQRGVRLRRSDGGLAVSAPPGALTAELRDALRDQRDALLELLDRSKVAGDVVAVTADPAGRYEPFPLTDIQHAYWAGAHSAVELGGVATHCYFEFDHVEGDWSDADPQRLAAALDRVVAANDMLRAVVAPDGTQRVLPEAPPYRIVHQDLRSYAEPEREQALLRTRESMAHQAQPAHRWPLFDVRTSRIGTAHLRLHVSVNILVVDFASLSLLFAQWRRCYRESHWRPAPTSVGYRDLVLAIRAARSGARYEQARRYWLDRIEALPGPPEIPLRRPPSSITQVRFTRRCQRIPKQLWAVLRAAARNAGITESVLLMTAFADVLRRWAGGQESMTLNLTLFERPPLHPDVERVLGDFTSLTMLEARARPGDAFADRARRISEQLLRDVEHASFTGVQVLRELARLRETGPAATMPVVFTSALGTPGGAAFLSELGFGLSQTPQVWLDLQVMEVDGSLLVNWDTVDGLFAEGLIEDMMAAYAGLLADLVADPQSWRRPGCVVRLPAHQAELRASVNATDTDDPPTTLWELVELQAELTPDADAVLTGSDRITYRDLLDRGRQLAWTLRAAGATAGEVIAVVADKGIEQVVAVLGVAASGAAFLPIDPNWPAARRDELLARCRVRTVVTAAELDLPPGPTIVATRAPQVVAAPTDPLPAGPAPDDLAYVIFTSGSTGAPKGVMIDHAAAANTIRDINRRFAITPLDRVLGLSALSFDLAVYDVFGTMAAGAALVLPEPTGVRDPAHWSRLACDHRVSVWDSVPALMRAFLDAPAAAAPELRLAMLSGDWIPLALPGRVRERCPAAQVVSLGGATEASIWSVLYPVDEVSPEWTSVPYGRPMANQQLYVRTPCLDECPIWTIGEICIGGVGLARGYWEDAAQTADRFVLDPRTGERLYRTGDLGRYLPNGDIEFLGRRDDQVKINGYRVELGEINEALRRQPGLAQAVAAVRTSSATGTRQLVGYLVPEPGHDVHTAKIQEALGTTLPRYMVPRRYVTLDAMPLSANGKVALDRLPEPDATPARSTVPDELGPADDWERRLHTIVREILEVDELGRHDNLFELGADSMHAVAILSRMGQELGLVFDDGEQGLQLLFEAPTVAELAAAVRTGEAR